MITFNYLFDNHEKIAYKLLKQMLHASIRSHYCTLNLKSPGKRESLSYAIPKVSNAESNYCFV